MLWTVLANRKTIAIIPTASLGNQPFQLQLQSTTFLRYSIFLPARTDVDLRKFVTGSLVNQ